VIVPVVQEDFFEVLRGRRIVDDDPGIAVGEDAFAGPVHTGDDYFLVVEHKSLVVNFVLNFDVVEVDAGSLKCLEAAFGQLELTQDNPHILARVDFSRDRIDEFGELGILLDSTSRSLRQKWGELAIVGEHSGCRLTK